MIAVSTLAAVHSVPSGLALAARAFGATRAVVSALERRGSAVLAAPKCAA